MGSDASKIIDELNSKPTEYIEPTLHRREVKNCFKKYKLKFAKNMAQFSDRLDTVRQKLE